MITEIIKARNYKADSRFAESFSSSKPFAAEIRQTKIQDRLDADFGKATIFEGFPERSQNPFGLENGKERWNHEPALSKSVSTNESNSAFMYI